MFHFIVNPSAKGGKLEKEWKLLNNIIADKFDNYKVHITEYKGHATEITEKLTSEDGPVSIIAVGGDGTVNEVINGIVNFNVTTFGYIPFGSGMDFARGNNLPLSPNEAINVILEGNTKGTKIGKIIYGNLSEKKFASNCGIGFDAEVSREANVEKLNIKKFFNKLNLGPLTYVYFVIKQLISFNRIKFKLNLDGNSVTYNNSWFITFCNHPFVGGGMIMNPEAIPAENILDATIGFNISRLRLLTLFPKIYKGNHINKKGVELLKGHHYDIKSSQSIEIHIDGEVIGKYSDFKVNLNSERLKIYY